MKIGNRIISRITTLALAACIAAALLCSCGGSGDGDETTAPNSETTPEVTTEQTTAKPETTEPETTEVTEPEPEPEPEPKKPNIGEIHNLLHIASEKYQDADGFVNVSSSGLYIKRVKPDFNVRAYGYSKLPELLAAFPNKYQIKRYEGKGGATIIAYKCL